MNKDAGLAPDGRPNTSPVEARLLAFGPGKVVNVWTPLVEATPTTGCMKAIPGSHKFGLQEHVVIINIATKQPINGPHKCKCFNTIVLIDSLIMIRLMEFLQEMKVDLGSASCLHSKIMLLRCCQVIMDCLRSPSTMPIFT